MAEPWNVVHVFEVDSESETEGGIKLDGCGRREQPVNPSGQCDTASRREPSAAKPDEHLVVGAGALQVSSVAEERTSEVRGADVHAKEAESARPGPELAKPGLRIHDAPNPSRSVEVGRRVILHVDCNCFFLAVHMRHDPSLRQAGPLVLWQYNDVICVSPEAKAVGVRKHMRPTEAQPLVESIGGRMVHAFSRKWPGPRVWYGPYNQASREIFTWLRAFLDQELLGSYVLERVSVDEAYIDVSTAVRGSLCAAAALARRLAAAMAEATGIRASVGVAPNRLLAKLASLAAKPPRDGVYAVAAGHTDLMGTGEERHGDQEVMSGTVEDLLQVTVASKLPGFGGRAAQLEALGLRKASDLWEVPAAELQAKLGLTSEAAARLAEMCQGRDATPVQPGDPKKSLAATSWLTDAFLGDVALKTHAGRGGEAVTVGNGWVFEPHADRRVSNSTRARWILLALVLDLEERIVEEFLEFRQLPTKLTVSYQGPGTRKEPGLAGFTDGHTHSRTAPFPTAAFRGLRAEDSRAAAFIRPPATAAPEAAQAAAPLPAAAAPAPRVHKHSVYGTEFLAPTTAPTAPGLPDGPEALAAPRYRARVAALVDACAALLSTWARELPAPAPVAQLTLTARGMEAMPGQGFAHAASRRAEGSAQRTLETFFQAGKRPREEPAAPGAAEAVASGVAATSAAVKKRGRVGGDVHEKPVWEIPEIEVSDGE